MPSLTMDSEKTFDQKLDEESFLNDKTLKHTTLPSHPLRCSICQEIFKVPKVLPCLHTFCEKCLIHCIPAQSLSLTCPQCGLLSILPEEGIPGLQTNYCVANLMMDTGSIESKNTESKEGPENEDTKSGDEEIEREKDVNSNRVNEDENKKPEPNPRLYCLSHSAQTLRFYCRECDAAICSSCTDIEHARHRTMRIGDAVSKDRKQLEGMLYNSKTKIEKLQNTVDQAEQMKAFLASAHDTTMSKIKNSFEDFYQRLRRREEDLTNELNNLYQNKLNLIEQWRKHLVAEIKDVEEYSHITEKALSHNDDLEILFVKKQIGNKLELCFEKDEANTNDLKSSIDTSLQFDSERLEKFDTSEIGKILSVMHMGWILFGDCVGSKCVKVCRRYVLTIQRSSSSPNEVSIKDFRIESSNNNCVFSIEEDVSVNPVQSFIIRFLAARVGPGKLSILLKGTHINVSPFVYHAYFDDDDRGSSCSPIPSPASSCGRRSVCSGSRLYSKSRIPTRISLPCGSVSASSRVSTPTKLSHSYSNGHLSEHRLGFCNGDTNSRRSNTLDDDLIMKIGRRGRAKGEFANPQGVASLPGGGLVVTDSNNQCVQIFTNTGECKLRFGVRGRRVGQLQRPVGVAILGNGNIAIADYDNKWISIFDQSGKLMSRIGHGKLLGPKGLAVDSSGLLYVVDNRASCVFVFQTNGKLVYKFGSRGNDEGQFAGPHFVGVNSKGNIIISDFHNHCVKVFDCEGDYLFCFGKNGDGMGEFNAPTGIAIDRKDNIIVADWGNSRIQVFDFQGSFISYISTSLDPLYGPQGLTVTSDDYIAVADSGNHCVRLYKHSP